MAFRLLYLIQLAIIITNVHTYDNELCSPDNWMTVEGDSLSFDNETCSATTNISDYNMAMLVYKTWPFLSYAQNASYGLEIEYNFTITATFNNTRATIGVMWYPDSDVYNYLGLSLTSNEAFVAYSYGIQRGFMYDHWLLTHDGNFSGFRNEAELPFTLSDTFYSMRVYIGSIQNNRIYGSITVNDMFVLGDYVYSEPFGSNNSDKAWIGIKSMNAAITSHSLSVYQTSNVNDGQSIIQRLKSFGAWQTTTETPLITTTDETVSTVYDEAASTVALTEDDDAYDDRATEDIESTYFVEEVAVSGVLGVSWLNLTLLFILLAFLICCMLCCVVLIVYLLLFPKQKKAKIVTKMLPNIVLMHNHQNQQKHIIQVEQKSLPVPVEPSLERQNTPEGGKQDRLCWLCNTVVINRETNTNGEIYCAKCDPEDDDMEAIDDNDGGTTKTTASGYEVKIVAIEDNNRYGRCNKEINAEEVKKEMKYRSNQKATRTKSTKRRNEAQNKSKRCVDCGASKRGKVDPENGLFHCDKCWVDYEQHDDMYHDHEPQLIHQKRVNAPQLMKVADLPEENTVGFEIRICDECSQKQMGRCDEDGSFYCNACWKHYDEDDMHTAGYIQ